MGKNQKADDLVKALFKSDLYDPKTYLFNRNLDNEEINATKGSYKNGLVGIALGMTGYQKELERLQSSLVEYLFDSQDNLFKASIENSEKIPDNSMLALLAINYNKLKHLIF